MPQWPPLGTVRTEGYSCVPVPRVQRERSRMRVAGMRSFISCALHLLKESWYVDRGIYTLPRQLAFPYQSIEKHHRNNSFHPGSDTALADLLTVPMRSSTGSSTANMQQMLWLQVYPPSLKGYSKTYMLLAVLMAEA